MMKTFRTADLFSNPALRRGRHFPGPCSVPRMTLMIAFMPLWKKKELGASEV